MFLFNLRFPSEKRELQNARGLKHIGPNTLHEPDPSHHRAASGNQVVDQYDLIFRPNVARVHLDAVFAVFKAGKTLSGFAMIERQ